ncbi:MAG: hypothetical protein F6K30_00735 [Cyanothece sp. SIO2G6]|nr:hypothetical protein [Cyanothece sp. SIO2G6]
MHNKKLPKQEQPKDPFLQLCEIIDYDISLIETTLDEIIKDVKGVHKVNIGKLGRLETRLTRQKKVIGEFRDTLFCYALNKDLESEVRNKLSSKYSKKVIALSKKITDIQARIDSKKSFLDAPLSKVEDIANPIKRILIVIAGFIGAVVGITKLPPSDDN